MKTPNAFADISIFKALPVACSLLLLSACGGSSSTNTAEPQHRLGSLPETVLHPVSNPTSQAKVELGRTLFWDPIMSAGKDVACVTCHHPDAGYADGLDISIGVGGQGLAADRKFGTFAMRNAPTVLNTAFNSIDHTGNYDPSQAMMFWDNRLKSLEKQALGPIESREEMRGFSNNAVSEAITDSIRNLISAEMRSAQTISHTADNQLIADLGSASEKVLSTGRENNLGQMVDIVVLRLKKYPEYLQLFQNAFGDTSITADTITAQRIGQAIAAFERSLINNNTPFDRYARGDSNALTREEVRGLNAFMAAGCNVCHSGPMFSDFELHQLPVPVNNKQPDDRGVNGKFRTPTLRNLASTAPYMHNGTKADLKSAIRFYHGISNPSGDPDLSQLKLSSDDATIEAIEKFLLTLSDDNFDKTIPASVPSGLNPGGDI